MTARWVVDEVAPARDLNITWQPISLFFKNEPEAGSDHHTYLFFTHRLLRVMEAVREGEGEGPVQDLYWQYGTAMHHDRNREFTAIEMLQASGIDTKYADAFDDESWDAEIRSRMDIGIGLAGDDIGTPIIAMEDQRGVKQGIFGPVITRVPSTEDSLAMWDALTTWLNVPGFWELKRNRTERPNFGDRPG